jgi:hypothetical protein
MPESNEKWRRRLLTYLDFARMDLEAGRAISSTFGRELEKWGKARLDELDKLNALQLIPVVESEGYHGDERFAEVARRLDRFRGVDPDERLIRSWWESARKDPKLRAHLEDEHLNRKKGRPKKPRAAK